MATPTSTSLPRIYEKPRLTGITRVNPTPLLFLHRQGSNILGAEVPIQTWVRMPERSIIMNAAAVPRHCDLEIVYAAALQGLVKSVELFIEISTRTQLDSMDMTTWLTPPQLHLSSELARQVRSAVCPVSLTIYWDLPLCVCGACVSASTSPKILLSHFLGRSDWQTSAHAASRNPNVTQVIRLQARKRCATPTTAPLQFTKDYVLVFPCSSSSALSTPASLIGRLAAPPSTGTKIVALDAPLPEEKASKDLFRVLVSGSSTTAEPSMPPPPPPPPPPSPPSPSPYPSSPSTSSYSPRTSASFSSFARAFKAGGK